MTVIIVGGALLVGGLFLFFSQGSVLSECQSGLGQLARAFSANAQQQCTTASTLQMLGGLGGALGAVIALVGAIKTAARPAAAGPTQDTAP